MAAKFVLKKSANGQYRFTLKAANGETILSGEHYTAKPSAETGIEAVRTNAPLDARYERKTAANGQFMFNLKAGNHQIVGTSETYTTEAARDRGIESVKANAPTARLDDES